MSKDFQLAFPCPHIIGEERVVLSSDRRSLVTRKPVGGYGLLRVVANDSLTISPGIGVTSRATLQSGRKEPYQVLRGQNQLVVRSATQYLDVSLPAGYLSSQTVATAVNDAVRARYGVLGTLEAFVADGCLVVTETADQAQSSRVSVEGTARDALGFDHQHGASGRMVIPSWALYDRAVVEDGGEGYFIRFDAPVKGNFYFSVTYSVNPRMCLRCLGTEVENDFRFDAQGQPLMVRDFNYLYQACVKIILTQVKSNIYYQWYGTALQKSVGQKALAGVSATIQQTVKQALSNLQAQQANQAKYQRLTAAERLYSVDRVNVIPSPVDLTTFLVDVQVRSFSNDPVLLTIVYTTPGTFALPGTNGLSLGNYGQETS